MGLYFIFASLPLFARGMPDLLCAMIILPVFFIIGNGFALSVIISAFTALIMLFKCSTPLLGGAEVEELFLISNESFC